MIVRASRPKVSFDTSRSLQSAFEQLSLPWLCPALHTKPDRIYRRQNATVTKKWIDRTRAHPPALRHPPSVQHRSLERKYAYAAAAEYPGDDYEDHVPFENLNHRYSQQNPPLHPWAFDRGLSELPSFDPSSPLVIHDSIQPAPRRFRSRGLTVGGDVGTIHQTLEACLKVGRFERAAATLRRLNFIYKPEAPELIEAHNAYLSSLIDRVVNTKDQQLLKQVQRWFEVDIRGQGIPPDPMTYGLMLRATFQEADQLKVDRTIRRYIGLAEQVDLRNEALAVALSTLNAQEIGRVTQVRPLLLEIFIWK
jgi:DNA-directed RNA polymerase